MSKEKARQVDKRAILAVIEAVVNAKEPTLVAEYKLVKSYLALIFAVENELDDYEKYEKAMRGLYNALVNKELKYVYLIYKDSDYNYFDLILISPIELNNEQLSIISKEASLYGSILQGGYLRLAEHVGLYLALERTISGLVTKWAGKDSVAEALVDAVTALAREYGLDFKDVRGVYAMFCLNYGICQGGET